MTGRQAYLEIFPSALKGRPDIRVASMIDFEKTPCVNSRNLCVGTAALPNPSKAEDLRVHMGQMARAWLHANQVGLLEHPGELYAAVRSTLWLKMMALVFVSIPVP